MGGLKGCMVLSPFCSRFCSPCFISLPFQRVPLLCNILHQSTQQTLTTPHVKDYFGQSHRDAVFFIFSRNKSCKLSVLNDCWVHREILIYGSTAYVPSSCIRSCSSFLILIRNYVCAENKLQLCSLSSK